MCYRSLPTSRQLAAIHITISRRRQLLVDRTSTINNRVVTYSKERMRCIIIIHANINSLFLHM
jgi:hypothetical protein